ncbi:MAG: hypothetical protein E6G67_12540 [Actinobacteria bacterium]|nr:MAG: hypothetical protein E6G67_12540 [Actinomycetota bacterium]
MTPTAYPLNGVKIPGQVGMFFRIVPKAEKSTGAQMLPRVSIVASAPCCNSPVASAPASVEGGRATRWRGSISAVVRPPVVTRISTGPASG